MMASGEKALQVCAQCGREFMAGQGRFMGACPRCERWMARAIGEYQRRLQARWAREDRSREAAA